MSKQKMLTAKELIQDKRYDEARKILRTVDHPTARAWEEKLNLIQPLSPTTNLISYGNNEPQNKSLWDYSYFAGIICLVAGFSIAPWLHSGYGDAYTYNIAINFTPRDFETALGTLFAWMFILSLVVNVFQKIRELPRKRISIFGTIPLIIWLIYTLVAHFNVYFKLGDTEGYLISWVQFMGIGIPIMIIGLIVTLFSLTMKQKQTL